MTSAGTSLAKSDSQRGLTLLREKPRRLKSLSIPNLHRFHWNILKMTLLTCQKCSVLFKPHSSWSIYAFPTPNGSDPRRNIPISSCSPQGFPPGWASLSSHDPIPLSPGVTLLIRFSAIVCAFRLAPHYLGVCSKVRPKLWLSRRLGRIVSSSHTGSARHRRLLQKRSKSALVQAPQRPWRIQVPQKRSRSGVGGVAEPPPASMPCSGPKRGRGWREERRGGCKFDFPASRKEETGVGKEEAEEKGVGAGQGPGRSRGGAGA